MVEILNATCTICGKKYHLCRTCERIESFQPWRTVCDTLPHYAIYVALARYRKTNDKSEAREALLRCDLSDLDGFDADKVKIIKEILKEEKVEKPITKSSVKTVARKEKASSHNEENDIE